jgi:AraC-like DNA-binding protein
MLSGVMLRTIQTATPRPELRDFIRTYAQREITADEPGSIQANIAVLEQVLAFEVRDRMHLEYPGHLDRPCPRINLWGSLTCPFGQHRLDGHIIGFAVFLRPHASWQLFRIPPAILANGHYDGEEVLGHPFQDLWHILAEAQSFAERVKRVEDYLLPFAMRAGAPTAIMRSADRLFACHGSVRIERLAQLTGLGVRQYERRFREELGCSPKLYARITRFQSAIDAKRRSQRRSWLQIAHQFGYFDQMHMVRDFQDLAGCAPTKTIEQINDLNPWSLAELLEISSKRLFP